VPISGTIHVPHNAATLQVRLNLDPLKADVRFDDFSLVRVN
jgi:hypothetical protein